MPNVKVDLPSFTGTTSLKLKVYKEGVLINDDGDDDLVEAAGSFGRFVANVSQSLLGAYEGVIVNASGAAVAFGYFDSTSLLVGSVTNETPAALNIEVEDRSITVL
jgi:hypothetical protein